MYQKDADSLRKTLSATTLPGYYNISSISDWIHNKGKQPLLRLDTDSIITAKKEAQT